MVTGLTFTNVKRNVVLVFTKLADLCNSLYTFYLCYSNFQSHKFKNICLNINIKVG